MTDQKHPNGISPEQAYDMLQEPNSVLIDIRSSMEFLFVGHPVGAIHVPWIDEPDWTINEDFVDDVKHIVARRTDPDKRPEPRVILICRSGKRTLEAGDALLAAGMRNVFHITEGFEGDLDENHHRGTLGGWRFRGLPWKQC